MPQPKRPIDQHRTATGMRLPKPLFAALNAYCDGHRHKPTRSLIIETAIREFLEREGAYPLATTVASKPVASPTASASP